MVPPRVTPNQWADARARREMGATFREVSQQTGVDASLLCRRARREGWGDGADVEDVIRKKVNERSHGVIPRMAPAEKAAAIDEAAQKSARLVERHREEWDAPRKAAYEGYDEKDAAKIRLAKTLAETIDIIQKGERRAWGLEVTEIRARNVGDAPTDNTIKIEFVRPAHDKSS